MATVSLRNVSKRYTGGRVVDALTPIDLDIDEGEFVTILGPSGSGKTTLLSIIVGIVPPTTGQVILEGQDITAADPRDRDMAMVFQNYALYPSKTVRGNLEFPLRMKGIAKEQRRSKAEEVAELLGLTPLLESHPRQLSGGQQQRVALGRALIRDPKLFLMDEPLSNLDAKLRHQMRTEIKRLHREYATTTVYVTHDQSEAMALSDRILVMNAGRVVQSGSPEDIFRYPADRFVAAFVGSPAMNIMSVTVEDGRGESVCRAKNGEELVRLGGAEPGQVMTNVELGIRPASVEWTVDGTQQGPGWIRAEIGELETLGDDTFLYVTAAGEAMTIVERGDRRPSVGQTIWVRMPPAAVHLFAGDAGKRVRFRQQVAGVPSPSLVRPGGEGLQQ